MELGKFAAISESEMKIIDDAEKKLADQCGHQVALIAYDVKRIRRKTRRSAAPCASPCFTYYISVPSIIRIISAGVTINSLIG